MIDQALVRLRPGAEWTLIGESYEGITWLDKKQTLPTKEEVEAEVQVVLAEIEAQKYKRQRMQEYPPLQEYIDGVVKGDQAQIQAYIDACLAVKAKYPKPE